MKTAYSQILGMIVIMVLAAVMVTGCVSKTKEPDVIAAGGTVTINGVPLPYAEVKFFPMEPGIDGNFVATAVSDDKGKFTLKLMGRQESGVSLGKNQVTVMEGPLPDEARAESDEAAKIASDFIKKLKNRPIPIQYLNLVTSPLKVEVVPGQSEYKLELER